MGLAKARKMDQEELGYSYNGNDYVCSECFTDEVIMRFVEENTTHNSCNYCGRSSEEPIAADLEKVIKFILEGIRTEYGDPDAEYVSYDTAEGGYQGEVIDSYDLLHDDYIDSFTEDEQLLEDILDAIRDRQWCQKDFYRLRPEEALLFGWKQFSEQVKHHSRYVFLKLPVSRGRNQDPDSIPASKMLGRLQDVIKSLTNLGLIKVVKKGHKIWRLRVHDPSLVCNNVATCGPPSFDDAKTSNRMSPAGIPMFYGAMDGRIPVCGVNSPS